MSTRDRTKHFTALAPTIPNTVARNQSVGDRSFIAVVAESGKAVLDSEFNLRVDVAQNVARQSLHKTSSGWLKSNPGIAAEDEWITGFVPDQFDPIGLVDGGFPTANVHTDGTLLNAVMIPKLRALVAGYPLTLEYTNTTADGYNLIALEAATVMDGTMGSVKRTDFLFLEVWQALVAPTTHAGASVLVVDASTAVGTVITLDGTPLTAVSSAAGVDEFVVDAYSAPNTALNIAAAINSGSNSFSATIRAAANNGTVYLRSIVPGLVGNAITLAVTPSVPGNVTVSGAVFTGGATRPNRPNDTQIYPHGNTQAPEDTWIDDESVEVPLLTETSQRIQLQYRVRATGAAEGINFKTHPTGFTAGTIYGQGGASAVDTDYPFVPADQTTTLGLSSAVAFGELDPQLYVAGDGSETAAAALNTVDGFIYALPLGFVFRHNDVSNAPALYRGFDPINNANGAPERDHAGYTGPLGTIPAGVSDRPDGEYCDVILNHHILDLRRHFATDWSGADEVTSQIQALMDGTFKTWAIDIADKQTLGGSTGDISTRPLVCNEIGRGPGVSEGGTAPLSGSTNRGVFVRNFDHMARRFAAQPIVERVVFAFYPGDRPDNLSQGDPTSYSYGTVNPGKYVVKTGGGTPVSEENWFEGDVLHLKMDDLDVSSLGKLFQGESGGGSSAAGIGAPTFTTYAPAGTRITNILSAYHDDGHFDLVGAGSTAQIQTVEIASVAGLGTDHVTVTLDANDRTVTGGLPSSLVSITVTAGGTGYSPGDAVTIAAPDQVGGVQAVAEVATIGGSGEVLTVTITDAGSGYTVAPVISFATGGASATGVAVLWQYRMVGGLDNTSTPVVDGSPRRIFLEVEITYPAGTGLTDSPDLTLTPNPSLYDGSNGVGPGAVVENGTSQRPKDFEGLLAPDFRAGYREVTLEYVANDTSVHTLGGERPGVPVGGVDAETVVSRNRSTVVFPRRVYGSTGTTEVYDATDTVSSARVVSDSSSEYGSSSRLVVLNTSGSGGAVPLSGLGQTLCEVQYYAQDAIPNYGASGGGYQVSTYYRTNAPQTAGVKDGDITTGGAGTLPTTLTLTPLSLGQSVFTGLRGAGTDEDAFPYVFPLDQIAVNDGTALTGVSPNQTAGSTYEWYFAAGAGVAVADFDADTGFLQLHPKIQAHKVGDWVFGGATNAGKPRKDAEFRAYYPAVADDNYRPTAFASPLSGAARHKVFMPALCRVPTAVAGAAGGVLFEAGEVVLVVLSRLATLDVDNKIVFADSGNTTCAAVYKTRNNWVI